MMSISVGLAATAAEKSNKTLPLQTVGEWKIFKSDETNYNSCIARHSKHAGITLNDSKLVISIPESKDLKSYQISVNDQSVIPASRANLVDTTCNCVRVRNINSLNVDTAAVRIQGQTNKDKSVDAYALSAQRAMAVSKSLIQRGISPGRITTIFYGDSRPQEKVGPNFSDRRVEFLLKKTDLRTEGRKVEAK